MGHGYVSATKIIDYAKSLRLERVISFDTETTGLTDDDEVLQLSISDGYGRPLLNEYVRPKHRRSWLEAQQIHGISPDDVMSCPTLDSITPTIHRIFSSASLILAYNIEFDDRMLKQSGYSLRNSAPVTPCVDVMLDYAAIINQDNGYGWVPLKKCAKHYHVNFDAHNSLEDARATALCFRGMLTDPEYQKHHVVPENISETKMDSASLVQYANPETGRVGLQFPATDTFERFLSKYWNQEHHAAITEGKVVVERTISVIMDDGTKIARFNQESEEYQALEKLAGNRVEITGREVNKRTMAKLYLQKKHGQSNF